MRKILLHWFDLSVSPKSCRVKFSSLLKVYPKLPVLPPLPTALSRILVFFPGLMSFKPQKSVFSLNTNLFLYPWASALSGICICSLFLFSSLWLTSFKWLYINHLLNEAIFDSPRSSPTLSLQVSSYKLLLFSFAYPLLLLDIYYSYYSCFLSLKLKNSWIP